ncbi:MAG: family 10 glycosylhydrolase, partial [Armatimonadetes bacterium]|nr:family 10 glycosylhydrolase [Armatimonadota bacterium]
VHSGQGALRVEIGADESNAGSRYGVIEVNQTRAETIMVALWLRFEPEKLADNWRVGVTFHVDFEGEDFLAWYGPFAGRTGDGGRWIYHEARYKPRAPIKDIRPAVYTKGFEGVVYLDDIYLGPVTDLPVVPRTTGPLVVTGARGNLTDIPEVDFLDLRPDAHVFHLAGENRANIRFTTEVNVAAGAPVYLNSAWGSQYWTLYCPARREIAEIYTDERLDLSQIGRHSFPLPMNAFSDHAFDLAPGDYVIITDRFKSFLIYGTDHPEGEPYVDARTGATRSYWDSVKVDPFSKIIGPSGVAAPFSLADLTSYELRVTAGTQGAVTSVRPVLVDANGVTVPLHGLELIARAGDTEPVALPEQVGSDGVPTGSYLWPAERDAPAKLRVSGTVRLAGPKDMKQEHLDAEVEVARLAVQPPPPPPPLTLVGWGGGVYAMSTSPANGPASARELVADAKAAGISRLVVHARGSRDDAYVSEISLSEPPEFDALAAICAEGKRQGVDIYAGYILGIAQKPDLEAHPEWAQLDKAGKQTGWYCYNNPEVRAFHAALMTELVRKYDIAGISVDYCRPGPGCFCERCQRLFREKYGRDLLECDYYDPDWIQFRRDSITEWMRELAATVRTARPGAKYTGYVWGRLAPEADRAGQDWPRWLAEGTMDWLCVGQYTPSTPMFRAQCHTLKLIADKYLDGDTSRICPLMGTSYIQDAWPSYALADAVIDGHLTAAREEGMVMAGYFPFHSIRTHIETSARYAAGGR